jgi:hypothetical protein
MKMQGPAVAAAASGLGRHAMTGHAATPASTRPEDAWLFAAACAQTRGDAGQASLLWAAYRRVHPGMAAGYFDVCSAFKTAARWDEADAVAVAAMANGTPGQMRAHKEHALVAEARGDMLSALQRWDAMVSAFPSNGTGYAGVVRLLLRLGRLDEADGFVIEACKRFPADVRLMRLAARVAMVRQDWRTALCRWDKFLASHPDNRAALEERGAALAELQTVSARAGVTDTDDAGDALVAVGRVEDPEAHDLLIGFESLGRNCEFGLVQRRFGAEPLGLLRWAGVSPATLLDLLESRFEGIGEPDNTRLHRAPGGEYWIRDLRFNLRFHTFIFSPVADIDGFIARHAARLRYLRDKLIADLDEGTKIFVYKTADLQSEADVERILGAIRRYGDNWLLCVEQAGTPGGAGSVRDCGGGLLTGGLSIVNPLPHNRWDIAFEEWLSLCRAARDCLQRASADAEPVAP